MAKTSTNKKAARSFAKKMKSKAESVAADLVMFDPDQPDLQALSAFVEAFGEIASEAEKAGFDPVEVMIKSGSRAHAHPNGSTIWVQLVGDRKSGRLLGAQLVGKEGAAHRVNAPAVALHAKMTVEEFGQSDLAYAPPFGPTWDPMLTAANQLIKKL